MIRYDLKCAAGHEFEAWFRSSEAYDELRSQGHVRCAICGRPDVEKQLMAPAVIGASGAGDTGADARSGGEALSRSASPMEAMLRALRKHIEEHSDYVGPEFAAEARRIHLGEAEARSIWGEASREEAEALKEEGIPVAPIPWMRRTDD